MVRELEAVYGLPRHGNPEDPLDDLVFIMLSNRTGSRVAERIFRELKARFPRWHEALFAPVDLQRILAPAGLGKKRSHALLEIFKQLLVDFGEVDLKLLQAKSDRILEAYLCSLPGVSQKVARCVMMYGFRRKVLPVDVHVHRITRRLGWHEHKRADQSHESLDRIIPSEFRYSFHVTCISHGRTVCRATSPRCNVCVLAKRCPSRDGK